MVPQPCGCLLIMSSRSGIRTRIQSVTNIVRFFPPSPSVSELIVRLSADLEITVSLLVQIDKLVQLIESPVFTCKLIEHVDLLN